MMVRVWQKIAFFGILYFVQGAVFAYVVNFQKPYLINRGLDMGSVGFFTSLLLVPFILKVFLGMLSDRVSFGRFGSRKPYMILGLSLFAVCYGRVASLDPAYNFTEFAVVSFIASIGLALFDTCCDGWAVDVARTEEQSAIQASMVSGRSIGFIVMSGVFGLLADVYSYAVIFLTLALMAVVVLLLVAVFPYKPLSVRKDSTTWSDLRELLKPQYLVLALYGVLYSISSFGTDGLLTLHLADVGLANVFDLGVFGVFRGLGALVGALTFVRFSRRYPSQQVHTMGLLALGAGCLLPLAGLPLTVAGVLWGLVWGFQETAFVTLAMACARGPWPATFFAVFMIFANVGTSMGEAAGASLAGRWGYTLVFVGFSGLAWLLAFTMPRLLSKKL